MENQRKQFKTVAKINGRGNDFADRVCNTVLRFDRGLANIKRQKKTAKLPIKVDAYGIQLFFGRTVT